jgi:hypothetical protein
VLFLNTLTPPCPALEKQNGAYVCGLIVNPSKYLYSGVLREQTYEKIRIFLLETFEFGVGCDSKLRCPEIDAGASAPGRKKKWNPALSQACPGVSTSGIPLKRRAKRGRPA